MPATRIGQEDWFLLGHYGKKHALRFLSSTKPKDARDPSDHRLREITLEGSVKWRPKDPAKINIEDIPPLGP